MVWPCSGHVISIKGNSFIRSFILEIYITHLQETYSEAEDKGLEESEEADELFRGSRVLLQGRAKIEKARCCRNARLTRWTKSSQLVAEYKALREGRSEIGGQSSDR